MDPQKVFATDRGKFDHDLSLLIDTAAAAASSSSTSHATSPSTAVTSPPVVIDPRLRKRSLQQPPVPSKKIKLEQPEVTSPAAPPPRAQRTGPNTIPLGFRKESKQTWDTLKNAVHRQWDTRKDDLAYEQLVAKRRAERLVNVDRYIPGDPLAPVPLPLIPPLLRRPSNALKAFPFEKLPDKIQDKILAFVVVRDEPLVIDFTWLRPFINGHCRIPTTTKTFTIGDVPYTMPLEWTTIIDVSLLSWRYLQLRYSKVEH